jgi:uncharacterized protein (TIGR02246 family)
MSEKASSLVAGAKQWATYYGQFTQGEESAALTAPLRARAAWDANDADAFADVFTENGSILVDDEQINGREAIRAFFTEAFADGGALAGTRIITDPIEIKVLEPGVAVVLTDGGVLHGAETTVPQQQTVRGSWVTVREGEEWRLVSQQTSPVKG